MYGFAILLFPIVFQILHQVAHGSSWKDAFLDVIPERKKAHEKKPQRCREEDKNSIDVISNCDEQTAADS